MRKRKLLIAAILATLTLGTVAATSVAFASNNSIFAGAKNDADYWNHYARVNPTTEKHGSKEFWASCSTHEYVLTYPGMGEDIREGVPFDTTAYFDELESSDPRYIPPISGDLEQNKIEAREAVLEAFDELDVDEYSAVRWNKIIDKLNSALEAINSAMTLEEVIDAKLDAISYFENSPKASEIVAGTWFDEHSSEANYEFDRDDNNKLVITYDGYPGRWVYCGTRTNLITDVTVNNVLALKFTNDIDEAIGVCLQVTNDSGSYKLDSHVVNVNAHETKTIELRYDVDISKLYFFLDSVEDDSINPHHSRQGRVIIEEQKLYYESRTPTEYYSPKTVDMHNVGFSKENSDEEVMSATKYTLETNDYPLFIDRVDVQVRVDYHGNSDSAKYFGLAFYFGSNHTRIGEAEAHASDEKIDGVSTGKTNFLFNVPVDSAKKLIPGEEIYVLVSYAAGPSEEHPTYNNLTFELTSYRFHYTLWRTEVSETINVNQKVWASSASTDEISVPFSSFAKKGRVNKMIINFTTVNKEGYGKSQIYIRNYQFTEFANGNNNVLNIGNIMDKTKTGDPTQGSIIVYPYNDVDLTEDVSITFECWWSCAVEINIDSIVMYTDNVEVPSAPTSLETHPFDSGVAIEWAKVNEASSYLIYKDGVQVDEVSRTSYRFTGLTNGVEYTFGVKAKNYVGASDMTSIKETPQEGVEYDDFINGLNTPLEELITQEGIDTMFDTSLVYLSKANNERFKSKLEAMKSGTPTKIAFMGGSITVGENAKQKDEDNHQKGYAYYTYEWLKNNYDTNGNSEFINASISGTGSEIGIVRAKKDILNHNPDIIFLEFAANNGSSTFYKQTYESLIRKFLALPSNPSVVLVFSCTSYTGSSENYMSAMGEFYHLPMFTIDKALRAICTPYNNKTVKGQDEIWDAFSNDGTHPNDEGHQLYAKCLANFCKQLDLKAKDDAAVIPSNPSQSGYDKYENLVSVDNVDNNEIITSYGSFVASNTGTPSTRDQSDVTAFQQGWKKTATDENEAMVIEVNAKNFIIIYEAGNPSVAGDPTGNIIVTYTNKNVSSDHGEITWDVSKTNKQNNMDDLNELVSSGNGWQNPVGILLFDKTNADDYIITIQMENVSDLATIMAFGYSN